MARGDRGDVSFIRLYFEDAAAGTCDMNDKQFTVYWRLIYRMLSHGGPLPTTTKEDRRRLARVCGQSLQAFEKVLNQLIEWSPKAKLQVIERGGETFVMQFRALSSLESAQEVARKLRETGRKSAKKRWENRAKTQQKQQNGDGLPINLPNANHKPVTRKSLLCANGSSRSGHEGQRSEPDLSGLTAAKAREFRALFIARRWNGELETRPDKLESAANE